MLKDIIYLRIGDTCYGRLGIDREIDKIYADAIALKIHKDIMKIHEDNKHSKNNKGLK